MESLKTLVNALRALFEGVDSKVADTRKSLEKVWDWLNGLAWVARSETIERLPETTVHFEGTWNADTQITAPLGAIVNTAGLVAGQQYTVYFDGNAYPMYYCVGEGGLDSGFFYDMDNPLFGGDFTLFSNSTEWVVLLTGGGASGAACDESHTFYIPAEVKPEEKLPNIFLDMDWIPKESKVDLLTDYVITDHPDDWYTQTNTLNREFRYKVPAPLFRMQEGETLTIIWGGERYSCVVTSVDEESYHIPVAGNLSLVRLGDEDNGIPFLIADLYTAANPTPEYELRPFVIDVQEDSAESLASSPLTVRANRLELPKVMLPQSVRDEIDGKLNKNNPSGTGYFEMNPWFDMDGDIEYTRGKCSFNVGHLGAARGDYSANIGGGYANGDNSISIMGARANTDCSIAIGYNATTDGTDGGIADASGKYAVAIGENAATSALNAVAIGYGVKAASAKQVAMGRYNIVDAVKKYLFILGNGTAGSARSNAFAVTPTGDGWFAGDVYVGSTSGKDKDEGSVKLLRDGGSGDGSNLTAAYTVPETREALKSGEKLSAALGKVSKWFSDLGGLAFKSTVAKTDLDTALRTQLTALDEDVARYKDGQLTTIAGVAIPTGGGSGGGGDVVVDTALNASSTNPVQNAAITEGINEAKTAASTAQTTADAAKTAANSANTAAGEAQDTATTALLEARAAATTAGNAMTKHNPTGNGEFSFNRKDDTTVGNGSVALGFNAEASGDYSFAGGRYSVASGLGAYTEGGSTTASGIDSHAEGAGTVAASDYQHVQGKYNVADSAGKYAHIVGGGTIGSDSARENIHTLDWSGNGWYKGTIECTGIIMKSPDGTKYKVTVENGGTLNVLVTA